jgi:hypothetical protein
MNFLGEGLFFLGAFCILSGCVCIVVGRRKIVNWIIGVRWNITMDNPDIWKAVNIRVGWIIVLHGIFMIAVALGLSEVNLTLFALSLFPPALAWTGYSYFYAYQLRRQLKR